MKSTVGFCQKVNYSNILNILLFILRFKFMIILLYLYGKFIKGQKQMSFLKKKPQYAVFLQGYKMQGFPLHLCPTLDQTC